MSYKKNLLVMKTEWDRPQASYKMAILYEQNLGTVCICLPKLSFWPRPSYPNLSLPQENTSVKFLVS